MDGQCDVEFLLRYSSELSYVVGKKGEVGGESCR